MTQTTISLTPEDLEAMIRRVVREEMRQTLLGRRPSILADMRHEGPADAAADEELLAEALGVLEQYGEDPEAWMSWEDFKAELAQAGANGELPS